MEEFLYSPVVLTVVVMFIIRSVTIISLFNKLRHSRENTTTLSDMKTLTEELMSLQSSGMVSLNNDGKFNWSVGKHTVDYLESDPNSITIDGKPASPMKTLALIHKITK